LDHNSGDPLDTPAILLMKVGSHGHEELASIVRRKQEEERAIGHTFWGYGGTLCHPQRVVQVFAKEAAARGQGVAVLFCVTRSPYYGDPVPADQYSVNGEHWEDLPTEARVTASKSALVLSNLRTCDDTLWLDGYRVALGPSSGRALNEYFRFRVDKAAAFAAARSTENRTPLSISFKAELVAPYAISVRRRPPPGCRPSTRTRR